MCSWATLRSRTAPTCPTVPSVTPLLFHFLQRGYLHELLNYHLECHLFRCRLKMSDGGARLRAVGSVVHAAQALDSNLFVTLSMTKCQRFLSMMLLAECVPPAALGHSPVAVYHTSARRPRNTRTARPIVRGQPSSQYPFKLWATEGHRLAPVTRRAISSFHVPDTPTCRARRSRERARGPSRATLAVAPRRAARRVVSRAG